jgi:hypothetical protein
MHGSVVVICRDAVCWEGRRRDRGSWVTRPSWARHKSVACGLERQDGCRGQDTEEVIITQSAWRLGTGWPARDEVPRSRGRAPVKTVYLLLSGDPEDLARSLLWPHYDTARTA